MGDNENPYRVPGLDPDEYSAYSPAGGYAIGQSEARFLRRWFGRRRWARRVALGIFVLVAAAMIGGCVLHLAGVFR